MSMEWKKSLDVIKVNIYAYAPKKLNILTFQMIWKLKKIGRFKKNSRKLEDCHEAETLEKSLFSDSLNYNYKWMK